MNKSVTNVYLRKNNELMGLYRHISTSKFCIDDMILISVGFYDSSYTNECQQVETYIKDNNFYRIRYHFREKLTDIVYMRLEKKRC